MSDTYGRAVTLTVFGESHGPAVGAVLTGLPGGVPVDEAEIARQMDKRRAKGGISTKRHEPDAVRFVSGVYRGRTTGTAVTLLIENTNTRSADYEKTALLARPGHADYTARVQAGGYNDPRGGGHTSGRLTAPLVAAGALCLQMLAAQGVRVGTHLAVCAGVPDAALPAGEAELAQALAALDTAAFPALDAEKGAAMQAAIAAAAAEGDSVGGILETAVTGLPAGLGEPFFSSVESQLAALLFSIPGIKGVEFGGGFGLAALRGSEANDPFCIREGRVATATNHNGGVNGGITNGMPVVFRTAVKPTPSIYKPQQTVDLASMTEAGLQIAGRHDPCIAHRARAVQDALTAFGLVDLLAQRRGKQWQEVF